MTDIEKLAKQLITARKEQGLSQQALAQKLGMKQSQISDLEAGKRDMRVSTLIEVSRALGLEMVVIPRASLPAVTYLIRSAKSEGNLVVEEQKAKYEIWEEDDEDQTM